MKRVIHKYSSDPYDHVCDEVSYEMVISKSLTKPQYECCSNAWNKVTCQKCLTEKKPNKKKGK